MSSFFEIVYLSALQSIPKWVESKWFHNFPKGINSIEM